MILSILVTWVQAGEWYTLRGEYCIDKCKYHGDDIMYYWCHGKYRNKLAFSLWWIWYWLFFSSKKVSHLTHKYSDGSGFSFGFDDRGPDTHLKWDKCVPSEIEFDDNVDEFK